MRIGRALHTLVERGEGGVGQTDGSRATAVCARQAFDTFIEVRSGVDGALRVSRSGTVAVIEAFYTAIQA